MLGILITLFILSILVLIHEAGHFFAAKWFGIKVEEFGYGIPPRAWGKKIGETIYSINWLPIGGFVKLFGEDDAGAGRVSLPKEHEQKKASKVDLKRAFYARPVWQRAVVVVAGVVMNALLAFVIYYAYLGLSNYQTMLPLLTDHKFGGVNQLNFNTGDRTDVISVVLPDSPAEKAGIKAPARIVSINNDRISGTDQIIKTINENKGKEITVIWEEVAVKNNQLVATATHTSKLTPRKNHPKTEGPTGIAFLPVAFLSYETPAQKAFSGIVHPLNLMAYNYDIMKELITVSVQEKDLRPASEGVSGPVGIFSLGMTIGQIPDMKEQLLQFLNLAGILSISLAFFNVLPIPALDGGRLFFILLEGIIGKKVSTKFETMAHTIGMAVLIGLILLVTFKDLVQLLT
jgi:regulator of sigma E protease